MKLLHLYATSVRRARFLLGAESQRDGSGSKLKLGGMALITIYLKGRLRNHFALSSASLSIWSHAIKKYYKGK